jgi:3-dehydroquinate dehydratase-1
MMKRLKIGSVVATERRPLVAVPMVDKTIAAIKSTAQVLRQTPADIVEWRIDFLLDLSELTVINIRQVHEILNKPMIFTWRTVDEGGKLTYHHDRYQSVYHDAIQAGIEAVDIEVTLLADQQDLLKLIPKDVQVIGSKHNFRATPAHLDACLAQMTKLPIDVAKLAVMPNDATDVERLLQATATVANESDVPLITMSMGELGMVSRELGYQFGSQLTFAVVNEASAPGQMPLATLLHKWGESYV